MKILTIAQIIIAFLLVVSVTLQNRGTTGGMSFSGGGETYRSKRGLERFLYYGTIILGVAFTSLSILALVLH